MLLNTKKVLITTRQKRMILDVSLLSLSYNEIDLQLTTGVKILGVYINENFQWDNHFKCICKNVSSYIWLLSKIKSYLTLEHRSVFYNAYIQPQFNYCNMIWGNSSNYNVSKLSKLQRRACKVILENELEDLDSARMKSIIFLTKLKLCIR